MRLRHILTAVAVLLAITPFPKTAFPDESADGTNAEMIRSIVSLSRESQAVGRRCEALLNTMRAETKDSEKKEFYASTFSALAAMNGAEKFPGTPIVTAEAIGDFLALDSMPTGLQAQQLRLALFSLSDCHSAEFYGFLTRLIDPRTQHLLTPDERIRARNLVLSYIRREAEGDAKPPIQMELITELLNQGAHTRLFLLSPEGSAELASLVSRVREYRNESIGGLAAWEKQGATISDSQAGAKHEVQLLENMADRFEQAESLRDDLQDLIESESEKGYLLPQTATQRGRLALLR